ncbi:MAG: hypothetical protein EA382_04910 [Spirochaetaceae bacterium]|nr:MAG: hypothetical protein EA382_04910 [Spirochaetaceae bacterium]
MSDQHDPMPQLDAESGFSEEERSEIRRYIDSIASTNRIEADRARFDRKTARPGLAIPLVVNISAVVGVLLAIVILRAAFVRDERSVQQDAVQFASIEGRLIRELQAESQALLMSKEQEIEQVRGQLLSLEREQALLETEFAGRIAERELELRQQIEAEIASERARLIAEGLNSEQIDRLMQEFEAEREAYYQRQIALFRGELERERSALEADIARLRNEYQRRLTELQAERDSLFAEFRQREDDLRVQLEQRTRVLEIARVEATAGLEAAQRELVQRERDTREVESVQRQIVGQFEAIQAAVTAGSPGVAVDRIDALIAYLNDDQVVRLEPLARRREMDLFVLRQLRTTIAQSIAAADVGSVTQELRLISQIRRLSGEADDAADPAVARERLDGLLRTLPEVARAHDRVVRQVRDDAVDEIRQTERTLLATSTNDATTLAAAGAYSQALDVYVSALQALPAVAPDLDRLVADLLRVGYAMSEYVIDGTRPAEVAAIAARAALDIQAERRQLEQRIADAIDAAVRAREAQLGVEIADLNARIAALRGESPDTAGFVALPDEEYERLTTVERQAAAERERLTEELRRTSAALATTERDRASLLIQRDRLIDERSALRARYTEFASAQQSAIARGDSVGIANARDAFFLSSELDLFLPGLSALIDQYDQQFAADQSAIGLSAFEVNEVIEELTVPLTAAQRRALLDNAIDTALDDGNDTLARFLALLADLVAVISAR